MSLYTQLTDQAIRQIAQKYPIEPIISWHLLQGGAENTNHLLLTKKQKYVLTLCERKTVAETTNLANLLQHLEKEGFESSKIIANKKGGSVSLYRGKPILLKDYIAGQVVEKLEEDVIFKIGQQMGKLHQIPVPDFVPTQFSYGQQQFQELAIQHPFSEWLAKKHALILENLSPDLPKSLIHGDIFASNVVIAKNNHPIIMDFEEACYYYRLFDMGMAITGICSENGQINPQKMKYLLAGYEGINPLTALEKEKVPIFIIYAATATAFWRFRQFNIYAPLAEMKDRYLEMQSIADYVGSADIPVY